MPVENLGGDPVAIQVRPDTAPAFHTGRKRREEKKIEKKCFRHACYMYEYTPKKILAENEKDDFFTVNSLNCKMGIFCRFLYVKGGRVMSIVVS